MKNPYLIKLSDEQKDKVIREIENELRKIQGERNKEDLETKWQANQDLYDGVVSPKDWPWSGASNYHIPMPAVMVDILTIRAKRQTLLSPIILLEQEEGQEEELEIEDIRNREDFLDFKLRKDINIEDLTATVYREAAVQGTGWLKCAHTELIEHPIFIERYQPTEEDLTRYRQDSIDTPEEERTKNLEKLYRGEEIFVKKEEELEVYYGPKASRIPIKDLYLRPSIKDLSRQKLIAERMEFSWIDIQYRLDTNFYDKEAIEKIKAQKGAEYHKKSYVFYECILYTNIEKEDTYRRYVFTIEDSTKTIVRSIYFPYKHYKIYYIPYYIIPRDDSVYGYGFMEKLKDTSKILNNLWNMAFDLVSLHANPPKQISDLNINLGSIDWGPGAVFTTPKGMDTFKMLILDPLNIDSLGLLSAAERFMEMATGVSSGMSGREAPLDPRAPASKTAMLLREANIRIEDCIIELQKGNSMLAEQVEALIMQYSPDKLNYLIGGERRDIKSETMRKKVRYVPHGVGAPINKQEELQGIIGFIQLMGQFPELAQNPETRRIVLRAYLDNLGGTLEKQKDKIMPEPKQSEEEMRKILEGMSPEEIEGLLTTTQMPQGKVPQEGVLKGEE